MQYQTDPLAEQTHEILPGLVWKYKNRALVLITYTCPSQCAFCFRQDLNTRRNRRASTNEIVKFIKNHPEIREVIFSGGEPLTKVPEIVEITNKLATSRQIDIFRIHTRQPITFPQSIPLTELTPLPLSIEQPIYMVIHANHPAELERVEVRTVLHKLRRAGFILLSHTVFLKGINDSVEILEQLFTRLAAWGVKPYYIFHCDHMLHTQRFELPLSEETRIMTELRKRISGLAYPLHVIDSASGKGKIPVPTDFWQWNTGIYLDFEGQNNPTA